MIFTRFQKLVRTTLDKLVRTMLLLERTSEMSMVRSNFNERG